MSILLANRYGTRGGALAWTLLVVGSLASLGANVAVAEPSLIGRIIAAWPSAALIGSYELLMSQIRRVPPAVRGSVLADRADARVSADGRSDRGRRRDHEIPHRFVGRHRRVRFEDLMAYKRQSDADRRKAADDLIALSEELDLY